MGFNLKKTIDRINEERGEGYRNVSYGDFLVVHVTPKIVKVTANGTADAYDMIRLGDGYIDNVEGEKYSALFRK